MSKNPVVASIRAPSVVTRALLAVTLVVGFYLVTVGIAAVLFAIPVGVFWVNGFRAIRAVLFVVAICWIPAFLLLSSIIGVKGARFTPTGRRIERHEAPELFAMVEALAAAASTRGPEEVYVTDDMGLSVTEDRGRRILQVGAVLLARTRVDELRAGLAHELGHFAFGDTRLLGLVSWAHALFRSVLSSTQRSPFDQSESSAIEAGYELAKAIGDGLATAYAKLFFFLTRPSDRRGELAADELAAKLAGRDAALALLDKTHVEGPLFDLYLQNEVGFALSTSALPTDLLAGFTTYAGRARERGLAAEVEQAVRNAVTDRYDTHPALADRVAALQQIPAAALPSVPHDARPAAALVAIDLEAIVGDAIAEAFAAENPLRAPRLVRGRWDELPALAYAPSLHENGRKVAAELHTAHPSAQTMTQMFAVVVRRLARGELETVVRVLARDFDAIPAHQRALLASDGGRMIVHGLFAAALLERGATMTPSLGDPGLVFEWHGQRVMPMKLASECITEAAAGAELLRWADMLEADEAVAAQPPEAAKPVLAFAG